MVDVYVFGLVVGVIAALAGMWILWQYAPEWVAMRLKDSEVLSVGQIEDYVDKMDWHYAKGDGIKKDPVEFPVAYPIKHPTDADVKATKKAAKDLQAFAAKIKAAPKKTKAATAKKKALTAKKKISKRA